MQKREITWIVVLLALIGIYLYLHQPAKPTIQIATSIRAIPRRRGSASTFPVYITLDHPYKISSIIVTPFNKPTNGEPREMWHLVSKSGSEPVKIFQYGQKVQGMEPDLKGVQAERLVPGEKYVMEITAGNIKGTSKPFTTQYLPQ